MSNQVEEHAQYLADHARMAAYESAISRRVRPGSVVVDLGSGTGILGLLAARAGAKRVHCIDLGPMLEVARAHVEANGYLDRFVFHRAHSSEVSLPELADLVVADQMSSFGIGAGGIEWFADAKRRLLKPEGHLLPSGLRLWVAGASQSDFRGQHAKIRDNTGGLDLSRFGYLMNHDVRHVPRAERCTTTAVFAEIELGTEEPTQLNATVELAAVEPGLVDGIAGWFSVTLADGVEFTNSPFAADRIQRNHIFLPFTRALQLSVGERLELSLRLRTRQEFYAWRVKQLDASGRILADFKQTSLAPSLLERAVIEQGADEHVPRLNAQGMLDRSILSLCDGARSLSELVDAVFEAHRSELPSRERALEAVTKTLRGNTQ